MNKRQDFSALYQRLGVTPNAGVPLVERIRNSEPLRVPWSTAYSSSGAMASRKMGCTIGFESRTLEYAYLIQLEGDHSVLEFYEQPHQLDIRTIKADGKRCGFKHVPDVLVISDASIQFVELKYESRLIALSERQPDRFVKCKDSWQSPAAEEALAGTGIGYRIVTEKDLRSVAIRNIRFLLDYRSVA